MKKIFISMILWLSIVSVQSQTIEQITDQFSAVSLSDIVAFNNKLYFFGSAEQHIYGLLSSDGVSSSTTVIKQIDGPSALLALNNKMIFFSNNQLWQSDGTTAGTSFLKNINRVSDFRFAVLDGKAYFAGDGTNSNPANDQLWVTDGTLDGTKLVKIINPTGPAGIMDIYAAGGKVYFSAYDGGGNGYYMQPWVTDGTANGTMKLKVVKSTKYNDAMPRNYTAFNGKVYFSMYDDLSACQLWVTDGTPAGTMKFTDSIGTSNGYGLSPYSLTVYNSKLYFAGSDLNSHTHLWATDGNAGNTKIIKPSIGPSYMVVYKNKIFMSAYDTVYGYELWSSDGTAEGTNRVTTWPGLRPTKIMPFQDKLVMLAGDSNTNTEVFISDGTNAGTICPTPPTNSSDVFTYFQGWVPLNNSVYFRAAYGHFTDYEIYRLINNSSGIKTKNAGLLIPVYPNPSKGLFKIALPQSIKNAEVEVYNNTSMLILKQSVSADMNLIDITNLPTGMYFLRVISNKEIIGSQKIVKN